MKRIRELKGGNINDGKKYEPIYNGDIKNPVTIVTKPRKLKENKC